MFNLVLALGFGMATSTDLTINLSERMSPRTQLPFFSVGSDRAKIFLRPEHQRDLEALQRATGFRYLRCHGLLNEEMHIVSRKPDGSLAFDWANVDAFLDQLRKAKLKPFVELGFIPEILASGTQTIFYWKGNVTPPKHQEEWAQLVSEFAKHEIAKRGLREVRDWYFEVWNEPNLSGFWTGGQEGYFRLYETSARALKGVDEKLRVGGPSTAGMGWIPEFLSFCSTHSVPVDFVSSHSYGTTEGFLDEHGHTKTVLDQNPESLHGEFLAARQHIKESAYPKLPLFISEWGPSYSPRDPIHDSYVCAPFILEKLHRNEGVVDGMSYWTFSDQFEEPGPPNTPFHGGFGMMTVDGLPKPAFLAYHFLAQLYKEEVPTENPHAIVTRHGDDLKILIWNYTALEQHEPDDPFFHKDLPATALPDQLVELKGLKPGTYRLTRVGIGYQRNDLFDAWVGMGKPTGEGAHLPADVFAKLRAATAAKPEVLPEVVVDASGTAEVRLPMRTNDVWLLSLSRETP